MKRILIIAGTVEARQLADRLVADGYAVAASVATPLGAQLLSNPELQVITGKKDSQQLTQMIRQFNPDYLVDASHPFAEAVSRNAMLACAETAVPYVRLERANSRTDRPSVQRVDSYQQAAQLAGQIVAAQGGKILLTVGSNQLEVFVREIAEAKQRLVVRALPVSSVLQKCEQLGLAPSNLFAAWGPFSLEMNLAIIRHVGATVLVSKDSGDAGGLEEKLDACEQAGIASILIQRPYVNYSLQFGEVGDLIAYLER